MFKALQCENRQKILKIVASNGKRVSSSDISNKLKISQPTALDHLRELERAGFLKEESYKPKTGRPGTKFTLSPKIHDRLEIERLGKLRFYVELVLEGG